MRKVYICYTWNEATKRLDWGIHDGETYIKRGFKTRKAAREYATSKSWEWK